MIFATVVLFAKSWWILVANITFWGQIFLNKIFSAGISVSVHLGEPCSCVCEKTKIQRWRQFVLLMICDTARAQMDSLGSSFLNHLPLKAHSYVLRKNGWSSLSSVQKSRQSAILFTLHAFSFSCPFGGVNSNQVPQNIENKQLFFVIFSWNLFSNNSDLLGLFQCHSSYLLQRWSEDRIQFSFYKHALGFFQLTVTSCLHTMGSNRFCVGSEIYREVEKTLETATTLLLLFPFLFTGKSLVI